VVRLSAISYQLSAVRPDTHRSGDGVGAPHAVPAKTRRPAHRAGYPLGGGRGEGSGRRLRLIGVAAALVVILAGCASSPEAARVRGEPGADPGNHGNPVVLLAPPERAERVYYEIPFVEQGAREDMSQS
jgi:hypothetical protein